MLKPLSALSDSSRGPIDDILLESTVQATSDWLVPASSNTSAERISARLVHSSNHTSRASAWSRSCLDQLRFLSFLAAVMKRDESREEPWIALLSTTGLVSLV
jgi:hypothetical protein